ncbi:DNA cytosine methyltransferase [Acetobacter indonesiensis]|uniref:DNA cytosine methyltransferase n=1 Tax=Acetobacter indonesiensis TaxID=104101 RepID=UPI000A064F6E|nr:DNA cytosine methyltransferase [Acetobacter indonesiensis]
MSFTCIDLFAGCGGLSLGLSQAGFEHLFAIEAHQHAFATYHQNLVQGKPYQSRWPAWLEQRAHDILHVIEKKERELVQLRGKVDLIAGGPPCQGFSMNGRRDPEDPRSKMINAYFDFVRLIRPKIVLLENVQGFASMPHGIFGNYPKFSQHRLTELGYESFETILPASDFGVPQRRPRYLLIGIEKDTLPGVNPIERLKVSRRSFLNKLGLGMTPTSVFDALSDLETIGAELIDDPEFGQSGFKSLLYRAPKTKSSYLRLMRNGWRGKPTDMRLAKHSEKVVARFEDILNNCKRGQSISVEDREKFGIKKRSVTPLNPLVPAPTITTLPDDLVHYSEPRTMTVREHARLQSFPDWFQFCGPYTTGGHRRKHDCPRYTQVGNAVPPLLARAIGETIHTLLLDQNSRNFSHSSQMLKEAAAKSRKVSNSHVGRSVPIQN